MAPGTSQSQPLELQVGHFFATPVAAAMLPDADRRNQALRQLILAEKKREQSVSASNMGGWHSGRPIEQWGGQRVGEILQAARVMAAKLTFDREGKPADVNWQTRTWANVNEYGHANEFHYHPGVYWSGTYYVDDGGAAQDDALGGEFEIMDPRGPGVAMYQPSLTFADGSRNTAGSTIKFSPRPGLLMLFPAWLQHQVRPYLGSSQRISIAFNLGVNSA